MGKFDELPAYHGDSIEIECNGFALTLTTRQDDDAGAPWENEDEHGPVSDWRRRNYAGHYPKAPGELLLCDDNPSGLRGNTCARFYDYQEACRIALRDGWNSEPYDIAGETKRQRAARAARADYDRLRRFCDGDWHYCGLIVTASKNGIELASASLWGIESDAESHAIAIANELADQAIDEARDALASLCDCDELTA